MIGPVNARVESDDAGLLSVGCAVEQQELQPLTRPGIDAKVDAASTTVAPSGKLQPVRRFMAAVRAARDGATSRVPPERHSIDEE